MKYISIETQSEATSGEALDADGNLNEGFRAIDSSVFNMLLGDVRIEQVFIEQELRLSDINIAYHDDADTRAVSTISAWREYRKSLRNYIQNGVIVGTKPNRPE